MTIKENKTSRRSFIAQSGMVAAGLSLGIKSSDAVSFQRIMGSNDRVRVGFIGIGNRGTQLLHLFMEQPDCEVAALCDVYEPYVLRDRSKVDPRYIQAMPGQIPKMGERFPGKVKLFADYRKMLDQKDIDAVCIATPDHWHAFQTIDALSAGKDIYVEKPLSRTIREGRAMVNAWEKSKQVVTVGLNRRGAPVFQKLSKEVPAGKIGKVTFASACHVGNMFPNGIGKMKPENPPKDFDWDLWLGPHTFQPYQYNLAPYMFRWWEDYCNQICNQGVHYLDLIRWLLNEEAPVTISSLGGKFAVDDDRTIPDTMQVTFEFGSGALASVNILEASSGSFIPYGFLEFRGTQGTLLTAENDYKIVPTRPGQFQSWDKLMEPETLNFSSDDKILSDGSYKNCTANLIRNFLDCVKTRQTPWATLETGHRSTTMAHLATIAMKTKHTLRWDALNERFINNEEANAYLSCEYRKPWKLF